MVTRRTQKRPNNGTTTAPAEDIIWVGVSQRNDLIQRNDVIQLGRIIAQTHQNHHHFLASLSYRHQNHHFRIVAAVLVICSQRLGADISSTAVYTAVRIPQLLHSPPLPPPINTSEDETWTIWRALLSLLLLYIAACCQICFFEGLGLLLVGVVNTFSNG